MRNLGIFAKSFYRDMHGTHRLFQPFKSCSEFLNILKIFIHACETYVRNIIKLG